MTTSSLHWKDLYQKEALLDAALKLYTKSIFKWQHSLITSHDNKTLYEFARHGTRHLDILHRRLLQEKFEFAPTQSKVINFNGKWRTIYIQTWQDKVVDTMLYVLLNRVFQSQFHIGSHAYRLGQFHLEACQNQVRRILNGERDPIFIIKRDVSNYFNSLDHSVLSQKLARYTGGSGYLHELLLSRIQHQFFNGENELCTAELGVAFGTPLACFFANLYFDDSDHRIARLCDLGYFRYSDDVLCLCSDHRQAVSVNDLLESEIRELKLQFKDSHKRNLCFTQSRKIDVPFESVDRFKFLGLEFRANGVHGLSKDKLEKIRKRFRLALKKRESAFKKLNTVEARAGLAIRILRETMEKSIRNVALIDYYLKHTQDELQLKDLDLWLALEVLFYSFQKGHKKGLFRRLSFNTMRAMGLPSFLHRSRLLRHQKIESSFFVWKSYQLSKKSRRKKWLPGKSDLPFSPCQEAESKIKVVGET